MVTGVSLSRWTMSYFAAALAALLLAEGLMAAGYGYPSASVESPRTLIVVHIVTIGWLSLLMCGALFQFVPVLIHRPLFNNVLTMPALLCLLGGLVALLSGFLWLDGQIEDALPFFPLASILLGFGFALVIWNLAGTLISGRPLPLPARFVGVGLVGISLTTALGTIFALVRGGVTDDAYLIDLAGRGVSLHALAGLAGWLTLCAIGVSYRLFAMFMLAPELDRRGTRLVLHLAICALVIAVPGGILAILSERSLDPMLLAAGTVGFAALGFYGRDMLYLYRARKRRTIELNTRMAVFAFASLGLTVLLTAILAGLGALERHAAAVVFLAAFGWLSGLGLAMLYKIVPFLTWLECYGPVLGKKATPRVQDLVVENRAEKWFLLYFASVWGGAAALLYEHSPAFQATAAGMLVATAGIIVQLLRARRLVDVSAEARFPEGRIGPACSIRSPKGHDKGRMTIMTTFVELDVRPILAAGGEPLGKIMETIGALAPGQGFRLLAPFRPVPLFQALGSMGFAHEDREISDGDWEVLFRHADQEDLADEMASAFVEAAWPSPLMHLDNRDLEPPEPMVRILAAIEAMQTGEVLSALLCREPVFLMPELEKRGHDWRGGFDRDGTTYRLLVRIGARREAAE